MANETFQLNLRDKAGLKLCWGLPITVSSGTPRNLRQESDGLADEINFEDFLTIMSYFRPIEMNMDEEQLDRFRKEKLKCETSPGSGVGAGGKGLP